jgi:lipoate-protein ligase A
MFIALPNAFGDAETNMAIDAALLVSMPVGLAAFRHYGWLGPAVTFGYAQHYNKVVSQLASDHVPVEPAQDSATLIRRMTGGGIVDHRNDWTYALILHSSIPAASSPATDLYAQIHDAISQSLAKIGIDSRLAPCPRHCEELPIASDIPSHCFATPAANDVLHPGGKKIAGAAMKRSRQGLLIQGSIDRSVLPKTFNFITFQKLLLKYLSSTLNLEPSELEDIRPLFKSEQIERERQRFAGDAWNRRR